MKLTGELKKKVDAAESRDEAKRAIADAGMELTDDELEQVAGGGSGGPQWRGPKFEIGQRVRVRWGPVAEKVGTVMSVQSKKFGNMVTYIYFVKLSEKRLDCEIGSDGWISEDKLEAVR